MNTASEHQFQVMLFWRNTDEDLVALAAGDVFVSPLANNNSDNLETGGIDQNDAVGRRANDAFTENPDYRYPGGQDQ